MAGEFTPTSPEKKHEAIETNEHEQKEKLDTLLEKAAETQEKSPAEIDQLEKAAEATAQSKEHIDIEHEQAPSEPTLGATKGLKKEAYRKTLAQAQKRLSVPQRAFSKIVHQPTIDAVSNVGAKTIARPSGLLSGGLCAFLGTSLLFYLAKHYGFRYNLFGFFLFLIGGFVIGLLIELLMRGYQKARGKS